MRRVLALAVVATLAVPASAAARRPAPHVSWFKCYRLCIDKRTVQRGGTIKVAGRRFRSRMRVIFRARNRHRKRTIKAQRVGSARVLARVPLDARSGRIYLRAPHGVKSKRSRRVLRVRKRRAKPTRPSDGGSPTGTAFDGDAMWIWNMPKTERGDVQAIIARAHAYGIETVFVKSGDGDNYWSQFSAGLVQALRAGGLHVCGWQYVYGSDPAGEAAVASLAVQNGAECFVIDAEREYQGRYAQAQQYTRTLRQAVGPDYPIGLSSFPYVDFHPGLPYSEFLAPGGAQFDVPQVYWKTIGDSVDDSLEHTYRFNRPYGRAIVPVGQAYNSPSASDVERFRQLVRAQGSPGLSWWSWESTSDATWTPIGAELGPFDGPPPATDFAPIQSGAKGDLVVWAQEHLQAAGQSLEVDGDFGPRTRAAVEGFQSANGLPVTGTVDTATWQALIGRYDPAPQAWRKRSRAKSAGLRAKRYEIPSSG